MNVCIIDDNKITADGMKQIIISTSKKVKENVDCYVFYNSEDFNEWLNTNVTDVCFLDINLDIEENADGLKLAKRLKQLNYNTLIIFISGYNDYYTDMVQVEPFRFLHKPFTKEEVIFAFQLACERYYLITNHEDIQKYQYKYNGIIFSEYLYKIKYIYSCKRKIYIQTSYGELLEFYGKLDNVEKEISELSNNFLRIGKSYLVNTKYVKSFNKNFVQIDNEEFSIGSKYKDKVVKILSNKIIT